MKKLFVLLAVVTCMAACAIDDLTVDFAGGYSSKIVYEWTSDGSGDAVGRTTTVLPGALFTVHCVPDTVAVPTDDYDVVIKRVFDNVDGGVDVIDTDLGQGSLEDLDDTDSTTVDFWPGFMIPAAGYLQVEVSNAGSATEGMVEIYVYRGLAIKRGDNGVPYGGSSGQMLIWNSLGQGSWFTMTGDTTIDASGETTTASSNSIDFPTSPIAGEDNYVMRYNHAGLEYVLGAPGGDVAGPVSSTDNAISKFDGTGGDTIQNSGVFIDDANNMNGIQDLTAADASITNTASASRFLAGGGYGSAGSTFDTDGNASINGDFVGDGSVSSGVDDTSQGYFSAYGDNATGGGLINIFNGGGEDGVIENWSLAASGSLFELGNDVIPNLFRYNSSGEFSAGVSDSTRGTGVFYGDSGTDGAYITLFNAADEDGVVNYFKQEADGLNFRLYPDAGPSAIYGLGTDDTSLASFYLYGNSTTGGAFQRFYNGADDDASTEYFQIKVDTDQLELGPDTDPDAFIFNSGGDLGIGVSPTSRLHVYEDLADIAIINIENPNSSAGVLVGAALKSTNDQGYYSLVGMINSASTVQGGIFQDTFNVYSQGYEDTAYTVDGNEDHVFYSDSGDGHAYGSTEKMRLTPAAILSLGLDDTLNGTLSVSGDNATSGGIISVKNAASEDANVSDFKIEADDIDMKFYPGSGVTTTYSFGVDDTIQSGLRVYGGTGTGGGFIDIYNATSDDTNTEYWALNPNGDEFHIGPDTDPDAFIFEDDGDFITVGSIETLSMEVGGGTASGSGSDFNSDGTIEADDQIRSNSGMFIGQDGANAGFQVRTFGSGTVSNSIVYHANGTEASATAVVDGDDLGYFGFNGFNGSGTGVGARIQAVATENWSPGNTASEIQFMTDGVSLKATLQANGDLVVGKNIFTQAGGRGVLMENQTGGASVAGQVVECHASIDDAFDTESTSGTDAIGVVYNAGVANGSDVWIITGGRAQILADANGFTNNERLGTSDTVAGAVEDIGGSPITALHFTEVAHACGDAASNSLGWAIIHPI